MAGMVAADWHEVIDRDLTAIARYDHSLAVPELGTLFRFEPESALGRAQAETARIYGVPFAYPSTNGTTMLNTLALMALVEPGDTVLIQRDSHVSVFAPLIHLGLRPAYVTPDFAPDLGVPLGVRPEQLRRALEEHPEARAIFLTYPNYFGVAGDLEGCVAVAREFGVPVVADAAHGAHLAFHPALPLPAERAGATIVTHSTHKTCGALGQSSLALFNDESLVPRFYELVNHLGFVSTSFSSVMLTTLFNAIWKLERDGQREIEERLEMVAWAREAINRVEGLSTFGAEAQRPGFVGFDPLRLTVNVARLGCTGFAVAEALREAGHYVEFATLDNVLILVTLGTDWPEMVHLVETLREIAARPRVAWRRCLPPAPAPPRQRMVPRKVFYSRRRRTLPAREAIGMVSAETISTLPPGSAVIVAGEEITAEVVEFLTAVRAHGGVLKGASDSELATMVVVER